jgi:D-alanyl-lipoteichoic acid acyltransferase DltB (MBOAT superfamily)
VFDAPRGNLHPAAAWIGVLAYSFQIYFDFSGYSDMAIGLARMFGIEFLENFDRPYLSRSFTEFWQRWHISLSSWFRDYLYIPLGGNRVPRWRWYFNLLFVFLVSGFWHGANWTFLAWGGLHGLYLIGSIVVDPARRAMLRLMRLRETSRLVRVAGLLLTFHLVTLAWVFFRAHSMGDAALILRNLARPEPGGLTFEYPLGAIDFTLALLSIVALVLVDALRGRFRLGEAIAARPTWQRWGVYYASAIGILFFGVLTQSRFIYFQF